MPSAGERQPGLGAARSVALVVGLCVALLAVFGWLGGDRLTGDEHNAIFFLEDSLRDYIANFHYGTLLKVQFWTLHELFGNSFLWYRMPAALATGAFLGWLAFHKVEGLPREPIAQALVVLLIAGNARFLFFARWGMPNYGESILIVALLLGSLLQDVARGRVPSWTPWRLAGMAVLPWVYPATTILLGAISSALLLAVLAGVVWRPDMVRGAGGFLRVAARSSVPLVLGALSLGLYRFSRADAHWERARGHHKSFSYWLEQGNDGVMSFVADSLARLGADLVQLAPVDGPGAKVLAQVYPLLGMGLGLCIAAALALVVVRAFRLRRDLPAVERGYLLAGGFLFTCVAACLAVTNLAALLDAFPMGSLRHMFFLIPALGLLAALSLAYLALLPGMPSGKTVVAGTRVAATACVVAFGLLLAMGLSHERKVAAGEQQALLAVLNAPGNDVTLAFEPGFYLSDTMLPATTRYFFTGSRRGIPEELLHAVHEVAGRPSGGRMAILVRVKELEKERSPIKRLIAELGLRQERSARHGRYVALALQIPHGVSLPTRRADVTVALPPEGIASVRIDPSRYRNAAVTIDGLALTDNAGVHAIDACADPQLKLMRSKRVDARAACSFDFGNGKNSGWFAPSRLRNLPATTEPRALRIRMTGELGSEIRVYLDLGQGYKTPIRVKLD